MKINLLLVCWSIILAFLIIHVGFGIAEDYHYELTGERLRPIVLEIIGNNDAE